MQISSSPIISILAVSPPPPPSTPKASRKIPDDKLNGSMRCGDTNQKKQMCSERHQVNLLSRPQVD